VWDWITLKVLIAISIFDWKFWSKKISSKWSKDSRESLQTFLRSPDPIIMLLPWYNYNENWLWLRFLTRDKKDFFSRSKQFTWAFPSIFVCEFNYYVIIHYISFVSSYFCFKMKKYPRLFPWKLFFDYFHNHAKNSPKKLSDNYTQKTNKNYTTRN